MELLWLTVDSGASYAPEITAMMKALRTEENVMTNTKKVERAKPYHQEFRDRDMCILLAMEKGDVAGMISFTPGLMGIIYRLYVKPVYRRRGVGDLLMQNTKDYMKRRGSIEFTVNTIPANEPAIALYKKYGLMPEYLSLRGKV